MFEVYKEDVTINGKPYRVSPLSGKNLGKLYKVIKKLPQAEGDKEEVSTKEVLEVLDEETISTIHYLALETMKECSPETDEKLIDVFVSQNLFVIFPIMLKVNLNNKAA